MSYPRSMLRCFGAAAAFSALFLVGCEDTGGRVPITGDVTFEGSPLDHGTIQFAAEDGSSMTGGTIENGKFSIPADRGAMPGTYVVRISSVEEGANPAEALPGDSMDVKNLERIPPEWNVNSAEKQEISADGENSFTFQIP